MEIFENMPAASIVVIVMILALFGMAVLMLFSLCAAYRRQMHHATLGDTVRSRMMNTALNDFEAAYAAFGQETNTPAIIASAINTHMSFGLFCERFLSNAVSLFVTLGLFGTFLGLSMSVTSLTELISFSSNSEWLGILDSVGGGLMSALSGMGVAFYTSLVGVACSIILTILRSIFSPESLRAAVETEMELWLDHSVAPRLEKDRPKDEADMVKHMVAAMNAVAESMNKSLRDSTVALQRTMMGFDATVNTFNKSVRDFGEIDYNLRGTVERLDVTVRDLNTKLRRTGREIERSEP